MFDIFMLFNIWDEETCEAAIFIDVNVFMLLFVFMIFYFTGVFLNKPMFLKK